MVLLAQIQVVIIEWGGKKCRLIKVANTRTHTPVAALSVRERTVDHLSGVSPACAGSDLF
jgi:hypothetical protein